MTLLVLFSLAVFATYLIIMAKNYGIQPSISDNYYVSKQPWVFTLVFWLVAVTMAPAMIDAAPVEWQFTGFFAGTGIAFVGAAAAYRQSMTNTVHIAGAITSALFAIVWAYTICPPIPTIAILTAAYILLAVRVHKVYWAEVTAFTMTYLTFFVSLLIN